MAELTKDQVRDRLLDHIWGLVDFWAAQGGDVKARLSGLAFGILSALDGEARTLPRFVVAADPRPEDRACHEGRGEDWFPDLDAAPWADVGGSLHERFHERKP